MKKDLHPDYHVIDVKMTDGTVVQMRRPGAPRATRCRSTSTRPPTRPGPVAATA